jgi:hypothetical protein
MKHRRITLLAVFVSMLSMGTAVAQVDSLTVRKELEAQYLKLGEAHEREDLSAILALKTADFHAIFPDGRVGDHKTMEEYTRGFLEGNDPPYNSKFTIQKLAVSDNGLIAVAEVLQEVSRYRELSGKRRKVDTSVVQRETWSKTSDGWKLKCVDNVHDNKRFVDGKRVDPTKPYAPEAPAYEPEGGGKGP